MLGWFHAARANAGFVDLAPGPMRQLPAGGRPAANRLGDGVEGHLEDVVQNEHHPLCGAEAFEHDEQGQPDLVVEGHPVGGIDG